MVNIIGSIFHCLFSFSLIIGIVLGSIALSGFIFGEFVDNIFSLIIAFVVTTFGVVFLIKKIVGRKNLKFIFLPFIFVE